MQPEVHSVCMQQVLDTVPIHVFLQGFPVSFRQRDAHAGGAYLARNMRALDPSRKLPVHEQHPDRNFESERLLRELSVLPQHRRPVPGRYVQRGVQLERLVDRPLARGHEDCQGPEGSGHYWPQLAAEDLPGDLILIALKDFIHPVACADGCPHVIDGGQRQEDGLEDFCGHLVLDLALCFGACHVVWKW